MLPYFFSQDLAKLLQGTESSFFLLVFAHGNMYYLYIYLVIQTFVRFQVPFFIICIYHLFDRDIWECVGV